MSLKPGSSCVELMLDPNAIHWYEDSPDYGKKTGVIICPKKTCCAKIGQFSLTGMICDC
jgi:hypothetical protein